MRHLVEIILLEFCVFLAVHVFISVLFGILALFGIIVFFDLTILFDIIVIIILISDSLVVVVITGIEALERDGSNADADDAPVPILIHILSYHKERLASIVPTEVTHHEGPRRQLVQCGFGVSSIPGPDDLVSSPSENDGDLPTKRCNGARLYSIRMTIEYHLGEWIPIIVYTCQVVPACRDEELRNLLRI